VIELRSALQEDALAVANVHVRSWQVGYRGLLPQEYLDSMQPEERAARYTFGHSDPTKAMTTVAVVDNAIQGFVTIGPRGHLMALYVDPDAWGRGLGRTLIADARRQLAARDERDAYLHVLDGNVRAERFYTADGWRPEGDLEQKTAWGVTFNERRWRRSL
jgi:GNAT superfamily N-acetyltransferase